MSLKRGASVDYQKNQILNAVVQNLSGAPSSPVAGQIYYDTSVNNFGYYNGSTWIYAVSVAAATSGALGTIQLTGDLGGTATSPQVTGLHLSADTAINHKLTSVTDPTNPQDAATKNYVDNSINGVSWKAPVVYATAAALPSYTTSGSGATAVLTASANGALSVDGSTPSVGNRILVKNEATGARNGIYTVTTVGTGSTPWVLTRAADTATTANVEAATVLVEQGSTLADTVWNQTTDNVTVDTTSQTWVQIQSATAIAGDGTYLTRTGNTININTASDEAAANATNGGNVATAAGVARIKKFVLKGDGSTTAFTLTHNLATAQVHVQGQIDNAGTPGQPIELDWTVVSTSAISVTFPTAPASATPYYVTIVG